MQRAYPSGAICPCQPKEKSTDFKPAEHIQNDIKCSLKFCRFSRGNFSVSPTWSGRPTTGAEQDQLPCGSTGTSSDNCQETETCMVRHVTRQDSLSKTIPQGTAEGGRRRGRQRKWWMDNIKELTSLPMPELLPWASRRKDWKWISAESSLMFLPRPDRSRD